jgi:predicted metal-dependent enzyme (double-stranded beta helix superfamily)
VAVLDQLIEGLTEACRPGSSPRQQAEYAAQELARSALSEGWLPPELQEPSDDGYCRRIAHVDPHGRFTLMVMSWKPGHTTPIHDHIAWCAVAVYRGMEESVEYSLHEEPDGAVLVERRRTRLRRGDTEVLVPPEENIHRVTCVGAEPAVSLHVYGADIRAAGSSINRTFDHLPIRSASPVGAGSWRRA